MRRLRTLLSLLSSWTLASKEVTGREVIRTACFGRSLCWVITCSLTRLERICEQSGVVGGRIAGSVCTVRSTLTRLGHICEHSREVGDQLQEALARCEHFGALAEQLQ